MKCLFIFQQKTIGMNEIIAIFYFCYENYNCDQLLNPEIDSFFCFSQLMKIFKKSFKEEKGSKNLGISEKIDEMNVILRNADSELWKYFIEIQITPDYYALRWILIIFSQDFFINDVMKIWDCIFSHPKKFKFVL